MDSLPSNQVIEQPKSRDVYHPKKMDLSNYERIIQEIQQKSGKMLTDEQMLLIMVSFECIKHLIRLLRNNNDRVIWSLWKEHFGDFGNKGYFEVSGWTILEMLTMNERLSYCEYCPSIFGLVNDISYCNASNSHVKTIGKHLKEKMVVIKKVLEEVGGYSNKMFTSRYCEKIEF